MQVILTIDYSPWSVYSGGAQQVVHNLALVLHNRGHNVHVIYTKPPWEHIDVPEDVPYTIHWGILPSPSSKRTSYLRPFSSLSVLKIAASLLKNGQETVIHSHGEEGGLIHLLLRNHKFAFICTPHHPHYPDALTFRENIPFLKKIKLGFREAKYLMQASAIRHAHLCTTPSRWSAELIHETFAIDYNRLQPVHNGVPEEFLSLKRKPEADKGPAIFFGRLCHTKGVDVLVDALHLLNEYAPKTLIVGQGELKSYLEDQIDKFGLQEKVNFLPWQNLEDLGQLITSCSMAILPSRHENFSLAILSALCTGTPTIATRVGGTPEIITSEENGLLVQPDSPEELASAIYRLHKSEPDLREKLSDNASSYIRRHLTWEQAGAHYEQIYLRVLRGRHSDTKQDRPSLYHSPLKEKRPW